MNKNRSNKHWLLAMLLITLLVIGMIGSSVQAEGTKSIQLNSTELEVATGKTAKLIATVENEKTQFTWESKDESVATVKAGTITGKGNGTTTIVCSTVLSDGSSLSAECKVTVYTPVRTITAAKTPGGKQTFVNVGKESAPFEIEINPENATCKNVTWSSSDESIATVDSQGRVIGKKPGKVTITATSDDPYSGGKPKSCAFKIDVNQGAEKITINGSSKIQKGKSEKLTYKISPIDTTNTKVTWSSSNEKVAKVTNGTVRAVGTGKCTITATTADGTKLQAKHSIEVVQYVTQLQTKIRGTVGITKGKTKSLSVTVLPKDATNKKLKWSSSKSSVATVDQNGKITAVALGECVITAKTTDGSGKKVEFKVCVEPLSPLIIDSIKVWYYYMNDPNCLQIFGYNTAKTRTIKKFKVGVLLYDSNDNLLDGWSDYWNCNVGPGKRYNPGSWHWYGLDYLTISKKIVIAVTELYYSDGTHETIPESELVLHTFQ